MTFKPSVLSSKRRCLSYILVTKVLEELQLSVCPLRKYWRAEGLHNFLDGDSLARQLILGGASADLSVLSLDCFRNFLPDETKGSHAHRLQVCVPTDFVSNMSACQEGAIYLLVISKIVPKIWARTNSAMLGDTDYTAGRTMTEDEV